MSKKACSPALHLLQKIGFFRRWAEKRREKELQRFRADFFSRFPRALAPERKQVYAQMVAGASGLAQRHAGSLKATLDILARDILRRKQLTLTDEARQAEIQRVLTSLRAAEEEPSPTP